MDRHELKKLIETDKEILYQKDFFDKLKSTSLLEFRKNINLIQEISPTLVIEKRVRQYYEELFNQYDSETKLFTEYAILLDKVLNRDYDFWENYSSFHYLISEEMIIQLRDFCHYGDRMEMAQNYLEKMTNQRLSEIVVDGLFGDTIYNVWINLRELLRYHDVLDDNERFLDSETLLFYKNILRIDKIDCEDKIKMYQNYKDNHIAFQFYQDLRVAKDKSYQNIRKNLFKVWEHQDDFNQNETVKWNYPIYELNGEDFYMLVRCNKLFSPTNDMRRNCYTLISGYHTEVFAKSQFIYGYDYFDIDDILHIFERDAYSSTGSVNKNRLDIPVVNRIMSPKQISNSTGYSEIQIVNNKILDSEQYESLRPSYLVVFDAIEEKHIKEATRLNIPIVKINTLPYLRRMMECSKKKYDLGFDEYRNILDDYTDGNYEESYRRNYR